jgi:hypothetical protein
MKKGILIGADKSAEELIPWWFRHYSRNCDLPVAIVDFGMSKKRRAWCKKRMEVIPFPDTVSVKPKDEIAPDHIKLWKKQYRGPLWQAREAWFKKPKACRLSPYDLTLWLDLDCEVCGPLDPLFREFNEGIELAIGLQDFRLDKPVVYNSGVILFRRGSPFLQEWDLRSHQQNGTMMGDQDVLTGMLLEGKILFKQLAPIYNWLMYAGIQPGIVIAHWAAGWGKEYIRKHGGLFDLLEQNEKI